MDDMIKITPEQLAELTALMRDDRISAGDALLLMKKKEIRERHVRIVDGIPKPIPVTWCPGDGKHGRWQTQVMIDGQWKVKKWTHEKDLYKYLDNYYAKKDTVTLATVYEEWHQGRMIEKPATAAKDQWVWDTYYLEHPIVSMPLRDIDVENIKAFLREICIAHRLTLRQLREAKTLLNLVYLYAYEKKLVDDLVPQRIAKMGDWACIRDEEERLPEEERFLLTEATKVCSAAVRLYHETDESLYLAILLSFQLGVRAGEMVCIHFGDIVGDILTLQRSEIKDYVVVDGKRIKKKGYKIVPRLKKKKKKRTLPLTKSALVVIDLLRQYNLAHGLGVGPDDPIFQRADGSVYHTNSLHRRQSKACKEAGLLHRSFHKIRKTWVSGLLTYTTIPITTIRDMAGHSDATMTLNVYGKTMLPDKKVRSEMEAALPDFSDGKVINS